MEQGWAYYAWSMENDAWLAFSGVRRVSRGYVGQQIDLLMEQVKACQKSE
jgi:hypothetical protein